MSKQHITELSIKHLTKMTWSEAKTLNPTQAEMALCLLRWPETQGQAICPHCAAQKCRKLTKSLSWECRSCSRQFNIKTGTPLLRTKADHEILFKLIYAAKEDITLHEAASTLKITLRQAAAWMERIKRSFEGELYFPENEAYLTHQGHLIHRKKRRQESLNPLKQQMASYLLIKDNRKKKRSEIVRDFPSCDPKLVERVYMDLSRWTAKMLESLAHERDPFEHLPEYPDAPSDKVFFRDPRHTS